MILLKLNGKYSSLIEMIFHYEIFNKFIPNVLISKQAAFFDIYINLVIIGPIYSKIPSVPLAS